MINIKVIIASERRRGNCELLGKYAEKLSNEKIQVKFVYLKHFDIKLCQGCMLCVFKNTRCKLEDDFYKFKEIINDADALLLISPTYINHTGEVEISNG